MVKKDIDNMLFIAVICIIFLVVGFCMVGQWKDEENYDNCISCYECIRKE